MAATALGVVAACGSGPAPVLDPPKLSSIASVPVPNSAVLDPSLGSAGAEGYRVPGVTFEQLAAWYERQMPEGRAFGSWKWCGKFENDNYYARNYAQGTAFLNVAIAPEPVGVLIATDSSGPC